MSDYACFIEGDDDPIEVRGAASPRSAAESAAVALYDRSAGEAFDPSGRLPALITVHGPEGTTCFDVTVDWAPTFHARAK